MATFRPQKRDLEVIDAILTTHPYLGTNASGAIRVALEEWRANHMIDQYEQNQEPKAKTKGEDQNR